MSEDCEKCGGKVATFAKVYRKENYAVVVKVCTAKGCDYFAKEVLERK